MSPEMLARPGTEDDHQAAIFCWAAMAAQFGFGAAQDPECYRVRGYAKETYGDALAVRDLEMLHATPNGGKRDMKTAIRLKATGTKAGYPDISLDVAKRGYHGLRIELKRPASDGKDEGRRSDEQLKWLTALTRQGYRAVLCVGWLEAKNEIVNYLT